MMRLAAAMIGTQVQASPELDRPQKETRVAWWQPWQWRQRTMSAARGAFAEKLAAARERVGISQYRLAQLSGISKQTVSKLELGTTQPSWETVQALAGA